MTWQVAHDVSDDVAVGAGGVGGRVRGGGWAGVGGVGGGAVVYDFGGVLTWHMATKLYG